KLLTKGDELPVFAFTLEDGIDNFTVFDVSNALRERGWLVPAYTFPANRTDLAALRIVVRQGFGHDMADLLLSDLRRTPPRLQAQPAPGHDASSASAFHHSEGLAECCTSPGRAARFVATDAGSVRSWATAATEDMRHGPRGVFRRHRPYFADPS